MAFSEESGNGMVMPVAPMYGGGNGNGFGFGGDWAWIILLLLLGWGNGGWGGNGFDGGAGGLYPWMNQAEITSGGFRDQMINGNITSVRDGIFDISTQLCNGFAGVNASIANGFAQSEIAANARQMADMQQNFALQSQFADCCCENRLATADLKYTVAQENCLDRQTISDGIRDVIAAQAAGFQSIKDELYRDRLDEKDDTIAQLRQEVLFARGQASQIAQNSTIIDGIYNRLDSCPVGTTPVFGRTPIFTCGGGNGCGCGGNSFFN